MKEVFKFLAPAALIFFAFFTILLIWVGEINFHNAQRDAELSKDKDQTMQYYGFEKHKDTYTGWEKITALFN